MLELFGDEYIFEHCFSELKKKEEKKAFDYYVAGCLRMISENTAKFAGGKYIDKSFVDMITPPKPQKSATEIKEDIKAKFRG